MSASATQGGHKNSDNDGDYDDDDGNLETTYGAPNMVSVIEVAKIRITRRIGTVHTSAKARLTSIATKI